MQRPSRLQSGSSRNGSPEMLQEVTRTGYTGWYLRVLTEGRAQAGDELKLVRRPAQTFTIAEANRIMHHDRQNLEAARQLRQVEGLAAVAAAPH